jgi:nucleolar MIF4G domain-containing protein 1
MKRKRSTTSGHSEGPNLIAQENARIAALEKKLGVQGRKSAPKSFQDDGLEDLFGIGLGDEDETLEGDKRAKTREYEEFLAQKRGLAGRRVEDDEVDDDEMSLLEDDADEFGGFPDGGDEEIEEDEDGNGGTRDLEGDGAFEVSEGEDDDEPPRPKRENPYVAPEEGRAAAYVPPQRRHLAGRAGSAKVRKEVKGLVNRLNAANLGGILKDTEKLYHSHSRGEVSEAIIAAILDQANNPTASTDTFFIDTAGFVAGVYRIAGESFASMTVTRLVQEFKSEYEEAKATPKAAGKATTALAALLSELYMFDLIGCNLLFDIIRLLLGSLSELNTELLLRITKVAGRKFAKEDPEALDDIAAQLRSFVSSAGATTVSERTKFMVESISSLKKRKGNREESDSVKERVATLKKMLGTLTRANPSGPLRIGLKDIEQMDTTGKWWLVGASFAGKMDEVEGGTGEVSATAGSRQELDKAEGNAEDSDLDLFFPDYANAAREQGLNTTAQQAIFASIAQSKSPADACQRYRRLNLNKQSKREAAAVVFQMAGAQQPYNSFYADVAELICDTRQARFALQARLWDVFRGLGLDIFDEEGKDVDGEDAIGYDEPRVSNIGRFAGSLVARSVLSVTALKCLDLMGLKKNKASLLVTHMLLATIRECLRKAKKDAEYRRKVERVFAPAVNEPVLAAGLHFFIAKVGKEAGKVDWVKMKDRSRVRDGCEHAKKVLTKEVVPEVSAAQPDAD